jgi:hypothetical protein
MASHAKLAKHAQSAVYFVEFWQVFDIRILPERHRHHNVAKSVNIAVHHPPT